MPWEQSFRWGFIKDEFGKTSAETIEKSPPILKNSAKNWCPVTTLISKIAANSPAARLGDSRGALRPAADLTLEQISVNPLQTAKIS